VCRVGLACVKGLAEALGKPAVAVSNLQALATFGSAPLRAVVLDARRGEIYGAVYDAAGRLAAPEVVTEFPAWLATLPEGYVVVRLNRFHALSRRPGRDALRARPIATAPPALAAAVARIALARFRGGEASDPAALDANYVRRPDAELVLEGVALWGRIVSCAPVFNRRRRPVYKRSGRVSNLPRIAASRKRWWRFSKAVAGD